VDLLIFDLLLSGGVPGVRLGNETGGKENNEHQKGGEQDGGWEWHKDVVKNPNAETFVDADGRSVLRHTAYVIGLCLRECIAGPLAGKMVENLKNKDSYASVPEFGTFWSDTPLSAWFRRPSAKMWMLCFTVLFTCMALLSPQRILFNRQGPSIYAMQAAVLDVTTDPYLHLEPIIFKSIGGMRVDSASLPVGYINQAHLPFGFLPDAIITNYSVLTSNSTSSW